MDQNESLITDEILLEELSKRIERYKSALENTSTYNKQLLELNKKLSESEAMKSHFISNITNEIINPFALFRSATCTAISISRLRSGLCPMIPKRCLILNNSCGVILKLTKCHAKVLQNLHICKYFA